jgi:hypothetical protein
VETIRRGCPPRHRHDDDHRRVDRRGCARTRRPHAASDPLRRRLRREPELARRQIVKRGERCVVKVPLLPTLFVTSSPKDAKAIFTQPESGLRLGQALRQMAPHEMLFGAEMVDWWNGENHATLLPRD